MQRKVAGRWSLVLRSPRLDVACVWGAAQGCWLHSTQGCDRLQQQQQQPAATCGRWLALCSHPARLRCWCRAPQLVPCTQAMLAGTLQQALESGFPAYEQVPPPAAATHLLHWQLCRTHDVRFAVLPTTVIPAFVALRQPRLGQRRAVFLSGARCLHVRRTRTHAAHTTALSAADLAAALPAAAAAC